MPVTGISLTGQINGTGALASYNTNNEMFLKVFSGEVLQTFETATVMKPLHTVRTISSGKSAQFPVTGIATAKYFTPGSDIMTENSMVSAIKHAEKIIHIDDLLLATTFIDKLDEAKNHYDVRSIYSTELGRALARTMDKNLIGLAVQTGAAFANAASTPFIPAASARAANLTGGYGSTVLQADLLGFASTNTSATVTSIARPDIDSGNSAATKFVELMFQMAAAFDAKDVPSEERYVVLTPTSYYNIVNSDAGKDLINRDYNPDPSSSFVNAQIASVAGFRMIRSNIAPQVFGQIVLPTGSGPTNVSFAPGHRNNPDQTQAGPTANPTQSAYAGNFSQVKAVCFQKQAFGTVKLLDLAMESEYDIRLQGHLMVAKYAMGHGSLRPECAGVLLGKAATT